MELIGDGIRGGVARDGDDGLRGDGDAAPPALTPRRLVGVLGPGVVAGGSDTDPTTVATLSVVGATTGFGLCWLVVLIVPMLVVVQTVSARVGMVARGGLEDAVNRRFGRGWAILMLLAVLAVNLVTLAADLEGGSAAVGLLTGHTYTWFLIPFAALSGLLLVWGSYQRVEGILKYVLLVFLAYGVTAVVAHPNWVEVAANTFVPRLETSSAYTTGALALLGTTLTSYAYVWESIAVAERKAPLRRLGLVQVEAGVGMAFAGIIFYFILVTTGATLGVHHTTVQTAQDAAHALAPLAGHFSEVIFGIGLLASAVLAVPVLAGTCAYVMAEAFGWRGSLDTKFATAPRFYAALLVSLVIALGIALLGESPIHLLFVASIAGGLGTPVTLALMMLIARDRRIMGDRRLSAPLVVAGWAVAAAVSLACLAFIVESVAGGGS